MASSSAGANGNGQINIPAGNYIALAAGGHPVFNTQFSAAIRSDGSLAAWGSNVFGQTNLPFTFAAHTALSLGDEHGLALRTDGGLDVWGNNNANQLNVPSATFMRFPRAGFTVWDSRRTIRSSPGATTRRTSWLFPLASSPALPPAILTASPFAAMVRSRAGALNTSGQATVPSGAYVAIAAGNSHSLGIKSDGTLAAWGDNTFGRNMPPAAPMRRSPTAMTIALPFAATARSRVGATTPLDRRPCPAASSWP